MYTFHKGFIGFNLADNPDFSNMTQIMGECDLPRAVGDSEQARAEDLKYVMTEYLFCESRSSAYTDLQKQFLSFVAKHLDSKELSISDVYHGDFNGLIYINFNNTSKSSKSCLKDGVIKPDKFITIKEKTVKDVEKFKQFCKDNMESNLFDYFIGLKENFGLCFIAASS